MFKFPIMILKRCLSLLSRTDVNVMHEFKVYLRPFSSLPPRMLPCRSLPLSILLLLLVVAEAGLCVAVTTQLHGSFRGCAVRDFSFVAQKPGCRNLRIETEACWGRCHTWEKPLPEPPYVQRHHRVCSYGRTRYLMVRLPGCQPHVSPLYPYPLALQCHCTVCSTQDTECETF
ncbi:glycoprotein hormone beta-5-like isoform X1 [Oncorhynchus tshawytscha]|uniref:Glycoprotein hormone subunit beta domain-containing protein n=2 Tax=Oncorhynchus tshawytscha TaxID=74940 RepID=A0AAZ3NVN9_ONCTS|nr:glycoprotein hormone beta-5-like isoform X1 [Oncorhynchus tshawytscha]